MPTVTRDIGRAYGRAGVIWLLTMIVGVPIGLCGVLSTIYLVTAFDFTPGVLFVVALMWMLPLALAVAAFVAVVRRRSSQLDALFVPLGLTGGPYMSWFRQYHGNVYGRAADVYLWRGPFLQIEIPTRINTRFGISQYQSDTGFIADLVGKQPLAPADPRLQGIMIFATDEEWTRRLLAEPTVIDAIRRLTALGSSVFTRQQVLLRPGAFVLLLSGNRRMFGIDITPEQARVWTDDLVRVAQAAEALPAPRQIAELSSAERLAQKLRTRNPYFELWVMLGTFGFFVIMAVVVFAAVFFFTSL